MTADVLMLALMQRIGYPCRVSYAAGRWTVEAEHPHLRGPGSTTAPTLALALTTLAERSDAIRAQCDAESAASDVAWEAGR